MNASHPPREKKRRRRWTKAEKRRLVTEFAQSGKSQVSFCEERGIVLGTFRNWLNATKNTPPTFAEVRFPGKDFSKGMTLEIELSNGIRLRIPDLGNPDQLGQLIRELSRC